MGSWEKNIRGIENIEIRGLRMTLLSLNNRNYCYKSNQYGNSEGGSDHHLN